MPSPLKGDADPELVATEAEGVHVAPALGPNIFYFEPDDLWFRYRYKRWYQAFRWDGTWFIQPDPPPVVVALVSLDPSTTKSQPSPNTKK